MSPDEKLEQLLDRYEDLREAGGSPTPESLCADCPELLPQLRAKLSLLNVFDGIARGKPEPAPDIPERLGRYRPIRLHAKGGLGEVHLAVDEELHREVALKRAQTLLGPDAKARFRLEAEITGRLEHPGIVPVYGLGRDAQGRPYYAMRFIRGETLDEALLRWHEQAGKGEPGRAALDFQKLMRAFLAVCQTLAYAHCRGVIHRDIKPANIMLGRYGETLVVDWGLAKAIGRKEGSAVAGEDSLRPLAADEIERTRIGTRRGSPAYMSPEQVDGKFAEFTPAIDIYALGATLYKLLAGKPPFTGGVDIFDRIVKGNFPKPSQVRPGVPAALEAVSLKCMSLSPADRYGSAAEVASEIEQWLVDEPVSAWREPAAVRLRRALHRNRTLVSTLAAVVMVGVVALAALWIQQSRANEDLERSNAELTDAVDAKNRALEASQRNATAARKSADDAGVQRMRAEKALQDNQSAQYWNRIRLCDYESRSGNLLEAMLALRSAAQGGGGVEWDVLNARLHAFRASVTAPAARARSAAALAATRDGSRLALGDDAGNVRLIDSKTGKALAWVGNPADRAGRLAGASRINALAFSVDGRMLFVAGPGNLLEVWEVADDHPRRVADPFHAISDLFPDEITGLAVSPDGKRLAAADVSRNIRIFRLDAPKLPPVSAGTGTGRRDNYRFTGDPDEVPPRPIFSSDGAELIVVETGELRHIDPADGKAIRTVPDAAATDARGHSAILCLAASADRVFLGCSDGTVRVRVGGAATPRTLPHRHDGAVEALVYDPVSRTVLSGGADGRVLRHRVDAVGPETAVTAHMGSVAAMALLGDGTFATAGAVRPLLKDQVGDPVPEVRVWDAEAFAEGRPLFAGSHVCASPAGRFWSTVHEGAVVLRRGADGEVVARPAVPATVKPSAGVFAPDGLHWAAFGDGGFALWSIQGDVVKPITVPLDDRFPSERLTLNRVSVKAMAFSAVGRRMAVLLAVGTADAAGIYPARLYVWNLDDLKPPIVWDAKVRTEPAFVAFSPDGAEVFAPGTDDAGRAGISVRSAVDGKPIRFDDEFKYVAFSPDGLVAARVRGAGASAVSLRVTRTDGRLLHETDLVLESFAGVAFPDDGSRLLVRGRHRDAVRFLLLDTLTGQRGPVLARPPGFGSEPVAVFARPDGRRIAFVEDGRVRITGSTGSTDIVHVGSK